MPLQWKKTRRLRICARRELCYKMPQPKVTELGKLHFLDDGGLVCSVVLREPPPLEASPRAASFYWASPDLTELAVGDLVAHYDHGVARFRGRQSLPEVSGEKKDYFVLEFAHHARLYVPGDRRDLIQKVSTADIQLSDIRGEKWTQSYCIEALANAYEWPGIGAFPEFPQESSRPGHGLTRMTHEAERRQGKAIAEWRQTCATYQKALHADASYRQAAQQYFERQNREPQPLLDWWAYRGVVLRVGTTESARVHNRDENLLHIRQYVLRRERTIEKIRREVETLENSESLEGTAREPIPENVRLFVWRRDKGQCVRCGSRERLEFDHIIPVIAGGSNTERNIQLLCESCNRSKGATV